LKVPGTMSKSENSRTYFCEEPWTGIFSVQIDGTVRCCPCYAKVVIGHLHESSLEEIWNSRTLVKMREDFSDGKLPEQCMGQLCPVVAGLDDS
jgi:MoaA/NifB/PqqE/SkfB family radical SAM enzyme